MKSTILLGAGLLVLFASGDALAGRLDNGSRGTYKNATYTKGKRGRKYARRFSLRENLTGDKLSVYDTYGYTPHRLRHRFAGDITERWKYHSLGLEFTFDEAGNIISTRRFSPEENHID